MKFGLFEHMDEVGCRKSGGAATMSLHEVRRASRQNAAAHVSVGSIAPPPADGSGSRRLLSPESDGRFQGYGWSRDARRNPTKSSSAVHWKRLHLFQNPGETLRHIP